MVESSGRTPGFHVAGAILPSLIVVEMLLVRHAGPWCKAGAGWQGMVEGMGSPFTVGANARILPERRNPDRLAVRAAWTGSGSGRRSSGTLDQLAVEVGQRRRADPEVLSNREIEVLRRIAAGESLNRIAEALHLSPKTVTTYRARIVEKIGLHSNAELCPLCSGARGC